MKHSTLTSDSTRPPAGDPIGDDLVLATFDEEDGLRELLTNIHLKTVDGPPSGGRCSFGSVLTTPSVASQGGTGSAEGSHGLWGATKENIGTTCLAEVGKSKEKFCTQDKDGCPHKTHQESTNRAPVKDGNIYVVDTKRHHAYLNHSVNSGQLLKGETMEGVVTITGTKKEMVSFVDVRNPSSQVKEVKEADPMAFDAVELDKLEEDTKVMFGTGMLSPNAKGASGEMKLTAVASLEDSKLPALKALEDPSGSQLLSALTLRVEQVETSQETLSRKQEEESDRLTRLTKLGDSVSASVNELRDNVVKDMTTCLDDSSQALTLATAASKKMPEMVGTINTMMGHLKQHKQVLAQNQHPEGVI